MFGIVFFLTGCTSPSRSKTPNTSWMGMTEQQLVSIWGIPNGQNDSGSYRYLTYSHSPGVIYSNGQVASEPCHVTFTLRANFVDSWSYEGNGCP